MSATVPPAAAANGHPNKERRCRTPGGAALGQEQSRDARKLAALILEVLAGTRTPTQAATALSVSVPRYYQLEGRALRGLLSACEAKPRGPGRNVDKELAKLRREQERLQREVGRQQALVRMAQRSIGVPAPAAPPAKAGGGKKRTRKPVARALSAAAHLQREDVTKSETESVAAPPAVTP
jgi:hypothetical protein